jgi:glucokinase
MLNQITDKPVLVADIGGTHTRFGLAVLDNDTWLIQTCERYLSADFGTFQHALNHYLTSLAEQGIPCPEYAGLAVAGPVQSGQVQLTNLAWQFGEQSLMREFNFKTVALVNDIAAVASGLDSTLEPKLQPLIGGSLQWQHPIAVVGIGTGFGSACLHAAKQWVVSTEAGHQQLAPYTPQQQCIWQSMRLNQPSLTVEQVLSGTGLTLLHQHWLQVHAQPPQSLSPRQIIRQALECGDVTCHAVVVCFYQWLAAVLGDLVLAQGAFGGLVLTGGVLPHFVDLIEARGDFAAHFNQRNVLSGYLDQIAVLVNMEEQTALIGAARSVTNLRSSVS